MQLQWAPALSSVLNLSFGKSFINYCIVYLLVTNSSKFSVACQRLFSGNYSNYACTHTYTHSLTLSHTHSLTLSHTCTHTHTYTFSYTHVHTHTHTVSNTCTHTFSYMHIHTRWNIKKRCEHFMLGIFWTFLSTA